MEQKGIKELQEFLNASMKLGILFYSQFKDGLQPNDFMEIIMSVMSDDEFKDAVIGIDQIPSEMKDLSFEEGAQLMVGLLGMVSKLKEMKEV